MKSLSLRPLAASVLAVLAPLALAQSPDRGGKEVVDAVCAACHAKGVKGAPKIGDRTAWNPRLKNGLDNVVRSAIRGHGGMPARGGQAALTDNEFRAAVTYMVNPVDTAPKDAPKGAAVKSSQSKTVGGVEIHLGLVSADSLRKAPEGSAERKMHGGVPKGSGYYHLNVTLLDDARKPVASAKVEARVEQAGMSGETKALDAMTLGGTPSYGAYFKLLPKTRYIVIVKALKSGSQPLEARFEQSTP